MQKRKTEARRIDPRTDFSKQKKNLINLRDRTPEERSAIGRKGAEARKKKQQEKMQLQKCMRALLTMKTKKPKQMQLLRDFGFEDEDLTNKTLLMVALFQKGLTGDVSAIRETINMMDKLDMFEKTGELTNNVTINLIATGEQFQPSEEIEKEIREAENYDPLEEEPVIPGTESDDEWEGWDSNDVYDPKEEMS